VVSLKPGPDGQRRRKKVSGKNKTEVRAKLARERENRFEAAVTTFIHAASGRLRATSPASGPGGPGQDASTSAA
jgi:hypothetical protein